MITALHAPNTALNVKASIDPINFHGVGGTTWPRLILQVSLHLEDERGNFWAERIQSTSFGMLTGELVIGAETIAYIRPTALNKRRLRNHGYGTNEYLPIEIELNAQRIEWIEQQRAGDTFEAILRISLQTHVWGSIEATPKSNFGLIESAAIFGEIPLTCPDSHWREKVLPGLGYGKVIVLQLPVIDSESCKALENSFLALKNAQKQFLLGQYDDAVGACRVALEPFFEQVEKVGEPGKRIPKLKKSWELSLGEATYQWLDSALSSIKTASNKPHHSPNRHFDRFGAQMLLTVTTSLIAYAARQQASEVDLASYSS